MTVAGIQIPKYPDEAVITRSHFSVPITRKRLLKIPTDDKINICDSNKTWSKALEVKSADNLSQTCQLLFESCVRIGYFIHSGVSVCFYKIVYWYPGI